MDRTFIIDGITYEIYKMGSTIAVYKDGVLLEDGIGSMSEALDAILSVYEV
jgi:hypothetical protein